MFDRPDKASPEYMEYKLQHQMYCFGGPGDGGDSGGDSRTDQEKAMDRELDQISADFDNMSQKDAAGESYSSGSDGGVGRGGNQNDYDGDGIPNSIDATPGVDRSNAGAFDGPSNMDDASRQYLDTSISNFRSTGSGARSPGASDGSDAPEPGLSDRVNELLKEQGYNANYKGTNASNKGNPIASGSYRAAVENAQRQEAYEQASELAAQNYLNRYKAAGKGPLYGYTQVSQNLIDLANGYDPNDPTTPPSAEAIRDAQIELGGLLQSGQYAPLSEDFNDPYNLNGNKGFLVGSDVREKEQFIENLSKGFNDKAGAWGRQLEVDPLGNLGWSTVGQRVVDFGLNYIAPTGPLTFNSMTAYGGEVPGYTNALNTVSIDPMGMVGNVLGKEVAGYVGPEVGKYAYEKTGNIDTAITAGVGGAVASGIGVESAFNDWGSNIGLNKALTMGYGSPTVYGPDNRSLSLSISEVMGETGGNSESTIDQSMLTPDDPKNELGNLPEAGKPVITDPIIIEDQGTPGVVAPSGKSNPQQKQQQALAEAYRQGGVPTDLTGVSQAGQDISAIGYQSPNADISYLTKGRQRDYGNTTYSVARPIQTYRSSRRRRLGDRLTGIVV